MFVFDRSVWTVAAGLGTALGFLALTLLFEGAPAESTAPAAVAELRTPLESGSEAGSHPRDISLAKR